MAKLWSWNTEISCWIFYFISNSKQELVTYTFYLLVYPISKSQNDLNQISRQVTSTDLPPLKQKFS
jgi:hypothetical protein